MNQTLKMSDLSSLSDESKNIFGLIIFVSYLWGSIGKAIFYNHINSFKIIERPINALILLGEIIHHSVISFITANLLIVLFAKETPAKFFFNQLGLKINEAVSKCYELFNMAKSDCTIRTRHCWTIRDVKQVILKWISWPFDQS